MPIRSSVRFIGLASLCAVASCLTPMARAQDAAPNVPLEAANDATAEIVVLGVQGNRATLSAGRDDGVRVGGVYVLTRDAGVPVEMRVVETRADESIAVVDDVLAATRVIVGDAVRFVRVQAGAPVTAPAPVTPITRGSSGPSPIASLPVAPMTRPDLTPNVQLNPRPNTAPNPAPVRIVPTQPMASVLQPAPVVPVATPTSVPPTNSSQFEAVGAVVTSVQERTVTLSAGTKSGVREGSRLAVTREGRVVGRVQVQSATDVAATGVFEPEQPADIVTVGDVVALEGGRSRRTISPPRPNRGADFVATAIVAALVLGADREAADSPRKALQADQQFSAISPFPGGGYSILPDGRIEPGGAMQVNIPLAYAPRRSNPVLGVYAAQDGRGQNIGDEEGRNGTLNIGLGGSLFGRGVWISRMVLSEVGLNGGDRAYNALVQLLAETKNAPAVAGGVQDFTQAREISPFLVATKTIPARRPLFVSLGYGRGRFSGDSVFGGVSFVPTERLSLAAEYDGLQINLGAAFAATRKITLLAALLDLNEQDDRVAGKLGRRFQLGASYRF